jgi:NTE family protein
MKKLGLALGAGGSRGVAHIGFLKALEEKGIKPDYICGCSMGSVVGAAYASGMSVDDMQRAVYKLRLLDLIAPSGQRGGLLGTQKMRKLLTKHIGDLDFSQLKIPFHCVATDLCSQSLVEFSQGSVIEAVIASSSIPVLFHPLDKDGMRLVDGTVLERVPAAQVKAMGADVVVAVDVLGRKDCSEDKPNVLGVLLEVVDLADNYRAKQRKEENADIIDFWLEPELGNMSQYELKQVRFAFEQGYALGLRHAKEIKESLEER